MIKLALVDDHKLFRSGIAALLSPMDDFEIVSESGNGAEFIESISSQTPEIVLMDLEMPEMDGMQTTAYLKQHFPEIKVIVLSMHNEEKFIVHLMEIGARGYLLKNSEPEDIVSAILSVHETGYFFSEMVSRVMLHGLVKKEKVKPSFKPNIELSDRELDVVKLICKELTTAEIGEKLFISPRTVEGHRNNAMLKTGVRNTAGLVVYAMKNGLFED
jgi:DNA-binding NarL/FixJ family response regulator